jgi:ATP-binding cassette subfamily B protein
MEKMNFRKTFSYLWPHIKEHKVSFFLIFFGYGVALLFQSIFRPYLFKEIVDLFSTTIDPVLLSHKVFVISILFIGTVIIYLAGYRTGDYANAYFQSKVMKRLYDSTFDKLLTHSYTFFSNNFTGSLVSKSKRFVKAFETAGDALAFNLWFVFVITIGVIVMLFINVPKLAWLFLLWVVIYVLMTIYFLNKKIKKDLSESEADSSVTGRLSDNITNIINIKIFSNSTKEKNSFKEITLNEEKRRRDAWYFGNGILALQSILMGILQISFVLLSIKYMKSGVFSVGIFVMVQTYLVNLFESLWNLGKSLTKVIKAFAEMKEVIDIFEQVPDIVDMPDAQKLHIETGAIEFRDVEFKYGNSNAVFENFNLTIQPGERVGIVGHSGAGKSTITKLLLRFVDTTEGAIFIDGQNIKEVTQDSLRNGLSYVPQESILFHRSIKENIAYGKRDATDVEIIDATKKAYADEFISSLKDGYNTMVGERGIKLSGGERQRVAIARAMLKNAPILVLDEATSSLDSVSEEYIQKSLDTLMKGKTTIVIAHRLSTIQKMDRIIVLEKGSIIEEGTHSMLLKQNGLYANLWNHQSGGFIT